MSKQLNSPSKIDQWCKPKPAAKLVLALVRLKIECFNHNRFF